MGLNEFEVLAVPFRERHGNASYISGGSESHAALICIKDAAVSGGLRIEDPAPFTTQPRPARRRPRPVRGSRYPTSG